MKRGNNTKNDIDLFGYGGVRSSMMASLTGRDELLIECVDSGISVLAPG